MISRIPIPTKIRRLIYDMYDNRCAHCSEGKRKILQIHHIDCDATNNSIDNLILVCAFCHIFVYHEEKAEQMIEWLLKTGRL